MKEIDERFLDMPKKASMFNQAAGFELKMKNKAFMASPDPTIKKKNLKKLSTAHATAEAFDSSILDKLQNGMQVEHTKFGTGKVISIEGEGGNKKATVFFKSVGQKQLLLKFAKLRILN